MLFQFYLINYIFVFSVFALMVFLILINGFFFFYSRFYLVNKYINLVYIVNILTFFLFFIMSLSFFLFFDFYNNEIFTTDVYASGVRVHKHLDDLKQHTGVALALYHVMRDLFINDYLPYFFIYFYQSLLYIDSTSLLFIILLSFLSAVCSITHLYQSVQLFSLKIANRNSSVFYSSVFNQNRTEQLNKKISDSFERNLHFLIKISLLFVSSFVFFSTSNILVLYIAFESSMLPLFFMIGSFGSRINKIKAAHMLFFFTLFGSIFFLSAITLIYSSTGSLDIFYLISVKFNPYTEKLIWFLLFVPFAVKIPIVPFHIWLPEAHVEASTEGSVLLAGIMLKLGLLAILKILIPLFPKASLFFTPLVNLFALISIIFISFNIFTQLDLKKIIAYSSIIHMNYALLGIFSHSILGLHGAVFLMFTHGIISSGLFLVVGFLYTRYHTRLITYYQGLSSTFPIFSSVFFILLLGNAAIPGTGGFVGEILIFMSLVKSNIFVAVISLIAPLSGAVYSVLIFVRMFFGVNTLSSCNSVSVNKTNFSSVTNKNWFYPLLSSEFSVFSIFVLLTIQTGLFPSIYLSRIEPSIMFYFSSYFCIQ